MRQTYALLVDAYRELNAKKLFWITLILSGLIVLAIAAVGFGREGVSIFGYTPDFLATPAGEAMSDQQVDQARSAFYKTAFDWIGIKIWLTWAAIILALFSTAGMFPDLIKEGAIDLLLSKPIGRLRLFLTKYVTGLLFVALQVAVFSVCAFFVIGVRAGDWDPKIFLAIPIVLLFFSYLFAVCVCVGVLTRSTLLAVIATGLVWVVMFVVNIADAQILELQAMRLVDADIAEARADYLVELPSEADDIEADPSAEDGTQAFTFDDWGQSPPTTREGYEAMFGSADDLRSQARDAHEQAAAFDKWRGYAFLAKTPLPKTGETRALMTRALNDPDDQEPIIFDPSSSQMDLYAPFGTMSQMISQRADALQRAQRGWAWVLLTSILFEGVVVGFAAWIFCRRDY